MTYIRIAAPVVAFLLAFTTILLILTEPEMFNKKKLGTDQSQGNYNHVNKLEELEHHISELVNATQGLTRVVEQEIALRKRLQAQVDALESGNGDKEIKCHNRPKSTH
jgi:hypothetical protein